ncbi:MAG: YciI family protein [Alphaproteobacteria bacterium]|nr:YciI family protein [Alphaproteobacteria bacterium]
MQYVALIYDVEDRPQSPSEFEEMMGGYFAFNETARGQGALLGGEALEPSSTATTVRVRDGEVLLTDGPFAETREALGGFYLLECRDLDHAIELAAKIPGASTGCVEVRPVLHIPGDG